MLADALARTKRLPLAGKISMTRPGPPPRGNWGQAALAPQKIVTTVTVTAISQVPLKDSLFALPSGYTQIAPPAPPRRPMEPPPGGPDGFGGPPPGGPMGPPPPLDGDRL